MRSQGSKSLRGGEARAGLGDYLRIARFDHVTKQVFIVPGFMLAFLLRGVHTNSLAVSVAFGLITAICVASANYVINEWLDRDFDKFHPTKSGRTAVQKELSRTIVLLEWITLVVLGLTCAYLASGVMLLVGSMFALQGIVYNVPPLRTKDRAYLDVISSVFLMYWAGGGFLMAAKRLSEFREIVASHGRQLLEQYRISFAGYSESSLTVSCFVYALFSSFFLAIFLVKYRIEYLIIVPFVIALFAQYLSLSMQPDSSAQKPEKLYREHTLIILVVLLVGAFALATFINFPWLDPFTGQRYISLD
jgi:4-hydroxybenzoate polyprenyltransferase